MPRNKQFEVDSAVFTGKLSVGRREDKSVSGPRAHLIEVKLIGSARVAGTEVAVAVTERFNFLQILESTDPIVSLAVKVNRTRGQDDIDFLAQSLAVRSLSSASASQ